MIFIVLTFLLPILLILVISFGASAIFPSWSQTLKWEAGLILASIVAFLGYFRLQEILAPPLPILPYLYWALKILAIISPTCIAVAWLRLAGVKWWQSLLLFLFVPIGVITLWLMNQFPFAS